MRRIAAREVPGAPHQTLLVLDATTGGNGLAQARRFVEAVGSHGRRPDEARRQRARRHRAGDLPRAEPARPLRRRRGGNGRPRAVRRDASTRRRSSASREGQTRPGGPRPGRSISASWIGRSHSPSAAGRAFRRIRWSGPSSCAAGRSSARPGTGGPAGRTRSGLALRRAGARAAGARPLRHPGTLQSLRTDAALHEAIRAAGIARVDLRDRAIPNPRWPAAGCVRSARSGIRTVRGGAARARAGGNSEREVPRLGGPGTPAVRPGEVGLEPRRTDRRVRRAEPLDHRRGGAAPGASPPRGARRGPRRRGNGPPDDPLLTRRLGSTGAGCTGASSSTDGSACRSDCRLLRSPAGLIVATARPPEHPKVRRIEARGACVWSLPEGRSSRVSIARLLRRLAEDGVTSLIVEGGSETLGRFFEAGVVDRVCVFVAPRILAGAQALGSVGGAGFPLARTPWLEGVEVERVGRDLMVSGRIARRPGPDSAASDGRLRRLMFTGIIAGVARVASIDRRSGGARLVLIPPPGEKAFSRGESVSDRGRVSDGAPTGPPSSRRTSPRRPCRARDSEASSPETP